LSDEPHPSSFKKVKPIPQSSEEAVQILTINKTTTSTKFTLKESYSTQMMKLKTN
jgi:hypothetical protein